MNDCPSNTQPPVTREAWLTAKLALPLAIGQLSQMLLGLADTLMVGHLGVTALAALSFANVLFHVPLVFGIGVLTSVSVFSSNARGADQPHEAVESCRSGMWLGGALGKGLFLASLLMIPLLGHFGQPGEVVEASLGYYVILMASLVPALASIALKNHADALNRPWPPFWIFLGGVVLNIGLNWVMIYGRLGFPALGLFGAGLATFLARMAIWGAMFVWLRRCRELAGWVPLRGWLRPSVVRLRQLTRVGFPASLQMVCEVTAFTVAGLLMGGFGTDALAAHQIAITMAATSFMIPLGISMALTVRVGEADGAGERGRLPRIASSGWLMVGIYGALAATMFLLGGRLITSWFVDNPAVASLGASLLVIVGVFQIVDGLQVASSAMLRGLKDTRLPAMMGVLSYWVIGLPTGLWLAHGAGLGPQGVWWGLAAGLSAACLTLGLRMMSKCRSHLRGCSGR